jgi:ankyrin repeat protein
MKKLTFIFVVTFVIISFVSILHAQEKQKNINKIVIGKPIVVKGKTPLIIAVENNDVKKVLSLIKSGANVNLTDSNGGTALLYAFLANNIEIEKVLLKNGADINNIFKGESLLLLASRNQSVEQVEFALKNNANPNAIDSNGETPLMVVFKRIKTAAKYKENGLDAMYEITKSDNSKIYKIIKMLIDNKADINYINKNKTVLDYALEAKCNKVINLLLKSRKVSGKGRDH